MEKRKLLVYSDKQWEYVDSEEYKLCKKLNFADWRLAKDNLATYKYQMAIQCIARREERYFKEWIEHHLRLGIEHIYIYDNNNEAGLEEFLRQILSAEDFSKIDIIPWREPMEWQQTEAVCDCIQKHKNEIKWLLSLDLDEFLIVEKPLDEFLETFSDAAEVYFSWESFGADGQLYYEDKPVMERFKRRFDCQDDGQGKVMFRPRRFKAWEIHSVVLTKGKIVNVLHEEINPPDSFNRIFRVAWIKHYFTKSLEEWVEKIKRGCADNYFGRRYDMFFEINPDLKKYFDANAPQKQKHSNPPKNEQ